MTKALTVKSGGEIQTADKTFWGVVEKWLEYLSVEKNKKARTISVYRYNMGVFKAWLDSEGIGEPTRQTIKDFKVYMTAQEWSVSTKNLYLVTVRNFYKWLAAEFGLVNIADGITGWQNTREHKRGVLSLSEMKELLDVVEPYTEKKIADKKAALKDKNCDVLFKRFEKTARLQCLRDRAILSALMAGGLRTIEICRLRVRDIGMSGGVCFLNVLGKGRDERELVKISRKAERVIRAWLAAREDVDVVSDDSPLFCSIAANSFGETLSSLSISRLCKEYLRAAGLKEKKYRAESAEKKFTVKPVVAHSLRASLATNAFRKGASLDAVKQQLRHQNIATTQIYLEESAKYLNPCSDLISEIF